MAIPEFEIKKIDGTELYNLLLDGVLVLSEVPFTTAVDYISKNEGEDNA